MFKLTKKRRFEAAHMLPSHDGKCARLHGHSWVVKVTISGPDLHEGGPKDGMLMDFGDLAAPLDHLIERKLDHYHLNESTPLKSPTSEALAVWIFDQLVGPYNAKGARLYSVTVEETCTSEATYIGENNAE